ncbi:thioredoxin family protein [Myroides odoratimimus]|uniref:Thioredoxin n=4 Tax=Myroides TaxID=76831 RepID=A0A0S7E801_9FLAO|nr:MULTISPECIES: thioredoxin family protein [Myroides]OJR86270.1 thiol reductase thioredoxin [Escherichia coli]AJA68015.1 Thioredoxin [Myroides sp. A21]AJH16478.1 thioredoxin 1 [Myroides profundi]ALU25332.1 thioredoxin [Myroides odoratimimus]APA91337.1 thiol reductase thioredoxin [Myroides sp. ZB35]
MSKFGELVTADVPVLIHFYAQWNEACTTMNPVLIDVAAAMGDRLRIVKIDVEKNGELVEALRIKQVPTMMLYKRGSMIWRQSGVMDANSLINVTKTL